MSDLSPDDGLRDIESRIVRYPGYLNFTQAGALLATIKHVVEPNWRELLALLDSPNVNPILGLELVQNVRKPVVADRFRAMLDQKLHNYLASAFTWVDHVRRIVKVRSDEPVQKMIAGKPALLANPEMPFMQDLRNFTLHRTLPVTSSRLNVTASSQDGMTMESSIELSVPSLLEWKNWTSASRSFLAAKGDAVKLRPVVAKHGELILTFNMVFFNDLEAANASHLEELNELVTQRNALIAGVSMEDARGITDAWTRRRNGEDIPVPGLDAPLFGGS